MSAPVRLSPGDAAPEFTLPDADGKPVSLADFRRRSVVVYCYPRHRPRRQAPQGTRCLIRRDRLENLRILDPNCNALTDRWCAHSKPA